MPNHFARINSARVTSYVIATDSATVQNSQQLRTMVDIDLVTSGLSALLDTTVHLKGTVSGKNVIELNFDHIHQFSFMRHWPEPGCDRPPHGSDYNILIKNFFGEVTPLMVLSHYTIHDVANVLKAKGGMPRTFWEPCCTCTFTCNGKPLKNMDVLQNNQFYEGSVMFLKKCPYCSGEDCKYVISEDLFDSQYDFVYPCDGKSLLSLRMLS